MNCGGSAFWPHASFCLRTRIANLQDFNRDPSLTDISEINVGALDLGGANIDAANDDDDDCYRN